MRNSIKPANWLARPLAVKRSRLLAVIGFVTISVWSQQSQATSLWLWGWLGISEIQIVQTTSGGGAIKDVPATAKLAVSTKNLTIDDNKKSAVVSKSQSSVEGHGKDTKDRNLRIIIM
jgi:hypothetical protein